MKKTIIGLAAIGALMVASQAMATPSTDSWGTALSGYTGNTEMKLLASTQYNPNTGMTSGQFIITNVFEYANNAPDPSTGYNFNSGSNPYQYFGTFYGLTDLVVNNQIVGFTMNPNVPAGFAIYEVTDGAKYTDSIATWGNTIALQGIFEAAGSNGQSAGQELVDGMGPLSGTGFLSYSGFASLLDGGLGGIYYNLFNSNSKIDSAGVRHDFTVTYNVEGTPVQNPNSGIFTGIGNDPVEGATVPEPTTMLLFGTGLIGLAGIGRRKLRK